MRFSPAIAARLVTLVLVSAGAGLYAAAGAIAKPDPAAPYLGMSVTAILACAGDPHSRFESGPNKETLVFRYTGTGPVPAEKAKTDDKTSGGKKSADKASDATKSDAMKSADKTSAATKSADKKSDDAKSAGKPSGDKTSDDKKPDTNKLSSIFGKNSKKKENADWTCSASLVFEDGKLVRVTFAHKGVHSPYDWQAEKDPVKQEEKRKEGVPTCEFSLPKCAR
jgi:hypothetical protein